MMSMVAAVRLMRNNLWLFLVVFGCFLVGCRTVEYVSVPVETVRVDSVFVAAVRVDSVVMRDSVLVASRGDSVFVDKVRYIYRYVGRVDTVSVLRVDTVAVPVVVKGGEEDSSSCGFPWGLVVLLVMILVPLVRYEWKRLRGKLDG